MLVPAGRVDLFTSSTGKGKHGKLFEYRTLGVSKISKSVLTVSLLPKTLVTISVIVYLPGTGSNFLIFGLFSVLATLVGPVILQSYLEIGETERVLDEVISAVSLIHLPVALIKAIT